MCEQLRNIALKLLCNVLVMEPVSARVEKNDDETKWSRCRRKFETSLTLWDIHSATRGIGSTEFRVDGTEIQRKLQIFRSLISARAQKSNGEKVTKVQMKIMKKCETTIVYYASLYCGPIYIVWREIFSKHGRRQLKGFSLQSIL